MPPRVPQLIQFQTSVLDQGAFRRPLIESFFFPAYFTPLSVPRLGGLDGELLCPSRRLRRNLLL